MVERRYLKLFGEGRVCYQIHGYRCNPFFYMIHSSKFSIEKRLKLEEEKRREEEEEKRRAMERDVGESW